MENRKSVTKKIVLFMCALACATGAAAQDLVQKIKAANRMPDMEYDYKIVLYDKALKKNLDSTRGHLAVKAGQYRDSNRHAFTARVGDYFCKLDHLRKTATVCNMKDLAKRMGVTLENNEQKSAYELTASLLNTKGKLVIDSSDSRYYRFKARLKDYELSYVQVDFSRSDYKMVAAYFETALRDQYGLQDDILNAITISNINHRVADAAFNLSNIYTLVAGKPMLGRKYAKYTLIRLER